MNIWMIRNNSIIHHNLKNSNACVVTKTINTSLTKSQRKDFLIHTNFLTATTRSLFHCCEKVLILMNIWMIGKYSIKHHYLKKKRRFLWSFQHGRCYGCRLRACKKSFEIKYLGEYYDFVCSKWYFIVSWCIWKL